MATCRLAPRERQVLELLATGRRNREIAQELGLSVGTVKAYLSDIYLKLGVGNRIEALRYAVASGLVQLSLPPT